MKSKKWIIVISVIIIAVIIFAIVMMTKQSNDTISDEDHLYSDSKAVIYYSATVDNTFNSVAAFVSKDNTVKGYAMDGLEFGSSTYNEKTKTILLEDKNSLKFVTDDGIQTAKFDNPEYTATSKGFLSKNNTFYSVNNTGVQEQNGEGYYSTIRYGNKDYTDSQLVGDWIQAVGNNGEDTIYSFVNYVSIKGEDATDNYRLIQSKLNDKKEFETTTIDELTSLNKLKDISIFNDFVYKDGVLYNLLNYKDDNNEVKTDLFVYDLKTKKLDLKLIADYDGAEFGLLNPTENIEMEGDNLYFVEDTGAVHQINMKTQTTKVLYTIDKGTNKDPLLQIKNNKLYLYILKDKAYYLDVLDLQTGKQLTSDKLQGMDEALNLGEGTNPYDLLILE
ncbi:hypothetical protein AAF454_06125 [Kurthia gibsonii]|uniref:DUF5050 domain-containing protein n=1 Tax=Kurthia gibsonii TaxID=33946 RepID=A0ABU9LKM8_9BACL